MQSPCGTRELALSRRPGRQGPSGAGTCRPGRDLILIPRRPLHGKFSLICAWKDPSATAGKTRCREPPGKLRRNIAVIWAGDVRGPGHSEWGTKGAAGQRPTRVLQGLWPIGRVLMGECLNFFDLSFLICGVWMSPPPEGPLFITKLYGALVSSRVLDPLCLPVSWGLTKPHDQPTFPGEGLSP